MKNTRLLIDLQSCQSGSRFGGIGRYSFELAKAMAELSGDNEVLFLLNGAERNFDPSLIRSLYKIVPNRNIVRFSAPSDQAYIKGLKSRRLLGELLREQFIESLNPDCVHITSLFEGFVDDVVMTVPERSDRPTAVTLYDLIPLANEEKYLQDKAAREHYLGRINQIKHADLLLAISDFSRKEGMAMLADRRGEIVNIRGGVDSRFIPPENPTVRPYDVVSFVGDSEYLLYTASFDQRKNQERLIEAFAIMIGARGDRFKLVIVGNGWPQAYERLYEIAVRCGVPRSMIIFTGKIPDITLVHLYQYARLFVFPPLWEGLGLPVLEAMACGTPVVGSDTTSVPEVVGRRDALFDPTDARAIAERMTYAAFDDDFNQELTAFGLEHVKLFTWAQSATTAWSAIEKLTASRRSSLSVAATRTGYADALVALADTIDEQELSDFASEAAFHFAFNEFEAQVPAVLLDRLHIAWVTSWGGRCGIAAYAKSLVDALPECRHRVFAPIAVRDDEPEAFVDRCWRHRSSETVEELGRRLLRSDCEIVHIQFNFGFFEPSGLNGLVDKLVQHDRRVIITLHSTQDPPSHNIADRLADYKPALARASALIVHADSDIERLSLIGISRRVWQIPQALRPFARAPLPVPKRRKFRLASYGFFLAHKGLPELIEAFAVLRARKVDADLMLVNACYGDDAGESRALIESCKHRSRELGLDDEVVFETEFLEDEQSADLLASADLIVFPYQTTEESSSAAVRMGLALRKPVLTTPLNIFHDVHEVSITLPGTSPELIADGINSFLDESAVGSPRLHALNERYGRWIWRHSQAIVADQHRRLLTRVFDAEFWTAVYKADLNALPTANAVKTPTKILGDPQAEGLVVFGPYVRLDPGLYRLDIDFEFHGDGGEEGRRRAVAVEIASQCGVNQIARREFRTPDDGSHVIFTVDEEMTDLEVRFFKEKSCEFALGGYTLAKRSGNELAA